MAECSRVILRGAGQFYLRTCLGRDYPAWTSRRNKCGSGGVILLLQGAFLTMLEVELAAFAEEGDDVVGFYYSYQVAFVVEDG